MNKQFRNIQTEFIFNEDNGICEGYGLKFNVLSEIMYDKDKKILFREKILPTALNGVLEKSDIVALFNHTDNLLLARYTPLKENNTLTLKVDDIGLFYSFVIPDTTVGNDLKYHLSKGNIRNSSFAFTTTAQGEKWEVINGENICTITQFEKIYDVSPVVFPAYPDANSNIRSIEEIKNNKTIMKDEFIKWFNELTEEEKNEILALIQPTEQPNEIEQNELTVEPVEPVEEVIEEELIDVVIDGVTIQLPKKLVEEYLPDATEEEVTEDELKRYFEAIDKKLSMLKK